MIADPICYNDARGRDLVRFCCAPRGQIKPIESVACRVRIEQNINAKFHALWRRATELISFGNHDHSPTLSAAAPATTARDWLRQNGARWARSQRSRTAPGIGDSSLSRDCPIFGPGSCTDLQDGFILQPFRWGIFYNVILSCGASEELTRF